MEVKRPSITERGALITCYCAGVMYCLVQSLNITLSVDSITLQEHNLLEHPLHMTYKIPEILALLYVKSSSLWLAIIQCMLYMYGIAQECLF